MGECEDNPTYMLRHCNKSCNCVRGEIDVGADQVILDKDYENETLDVITSSIDYYENKILTNNNDNASSPKPTCNNKHKLCSYWSSKGQCENNEEFMMNECSLACKACLLENNDEDEDKSCVDLIDNCEELKEAERYFCIDVIPVCRKTCNNCITKSDYGVKQNSIWMIQTTTINWKSYIMNQ